MVQVIEVDTGVSFTPSQQLRMLWSHPHLHFQGDGIGLRLTDQSAQRQAWTLQQMIDIGKAEPYQFVFSPEFSIPVAMVAEIEQAVSSPAWPAGSVFAGGIEPISVEQYRALSAHGNIAAADSIPRQRL